MTEALDKGKVRKAVLLYLSQKIGANNFADLQRECMSRDKQKTGFLSCKDLFTCFEKAYMNLLQREFEELMLELDPSKTGQVSYE
jgi:hypothetical protein